MIYFELTTLIVSGENDSEKDINDVCDWIVDNLGTNVPLHFSRFYPYYLMKSKQITPFEVVEKAVRIARSKGIKYVYAGNVRNKDLNNTFCSKCKTELINRMGYDTHINNVLKGKCLKCGEKLLLYY
jgi:pyruvate formate lyase activating enzyme